MKVRYIGATEAQVRWGGCEDSRSLLTVGETYEVRREEVHSYHTKLHLKGYSDRGFNSVCFEVLKELER